MCLICQESVLQQELSNKQSGSEDWYKSIAKYSITKSNESKQRYEIFRAFCKDNEALVERTNVFNRISYKNMSDRDSTIRTHLNNHLTEELRKFNLDVQSRPM